MTQTDTELVWEFITIFARFKTHISVLMAELTAFQSVEEKNGGHTINDLP